MDLEKVLGYDNEEEVELTDDERLVYNLVRAQQHAQQALDVCYKVGGPKRSLWYRMVLGRAQSILMSLSVRELGKKFGKDE